MSPFLQLTLELVIIIAFAKVAGYISTRIGQPASFGVLEVRRIAILPNTGLSCVLLVTRANGVEQENPNT